MLPPLLAALAAAAGLVSGCSAGRIAGSGGSSTVTAPAAGERPAKQAAHATVGERFASAALDDHRLGEIRGGLSTGSGLVVSFSFQQATYVNHNLTQSIVVPTITVSPGANTASIAAATSSGGFSVAPMIGTAPSAQVSSPALMVQSLVNSGMTSVVSSLGGGVTNTVSNAANNQLVQQVITANVDIAGLSHTLQQSMASTVASRMAAANSQFR